MEAVAVVILAPILVLLLIYWIYYAVWRKWLGISSSWKAYKQNKLYHKYLSEGMSWIEADCRADHEVYGNKKAPRKRG